MLKHHFSKKLRQSIGKGECFSLIRWMVILLLALSVSLAMAVYGILSIDLPNWIKPLPPSNWIGFYGSMFGAFLNGSVTIFIFNETLRENRKTNSENKRVQSLPLLKL
ncbi:hypothetical protein [Paenibacillus sp. FSL R10-2748]|uniref:hypothetical protein n=1 Tax=Paenibacillus sp. FSL R10-2748 TaxID=2954658 RepID=UPI0030F9C77D